MMAEKSVNISQLPLPQLDRIKNQLDEVSNAHVTVGILRAYHNYVLFCKILVCQLAHPS